MTQYGAPPGGLPAQNELMTGRAVFTESYAVLPRGTMRDITASYFPHWRGARGWILARPLTGFAETFSQCLMELAPGGGSSDPEPDDGAEAGIFVTHGALTLTLGGHRHEMAPGGYAYLPPGKEWQADNLHNEPVRFHWIRKAYEPAEGLSAPESFVTREQDHEPVAMPDTDGRWATTRFVDPNDMRHDMHINIVTLQPGGVIPFEETHVMEHGLFVLQGKGVYRLGRDWVEVEAGDFMWLRAFCPQACYAGGPEPFRYLLYKDVNRHPKLRLP